MKKSQVLAAIALAFALGLAPIASTFALTSLKEQCNEAYDEATDLVLEFGTVDQITKLQNDVAILKKAYAPTAEEFKAAITSATAPGNTVDAVYTVAKAALNNSAKVNGKVLTINDFAGKNFDEVVALADSATYASYTQDAFDTMIDGAKAMLTPYISAIRKDLSAIDLADNLAADATAAQTIAYVNALPNYDKTVRLMEVRAANACAGDDKAMTKATENLKDAIAAYKGTTNNGGNTNTPVKPSTPDTGANTASEESATASVSILSGVASVVTAAGVVIRKAFRK